MHHTDCSAKADHVGHKTSVEVDSALAWTMPKLWKEEELHNYDVILMLGLGIVAYSLSNRQRRAI